MKIEYCTDVIATYNNNIVLIERLTFPLGLALPGGRRDMIEGKLEEVIDCGLREFEEETGLSLIVDGVLGIYDSNNRDPRGEKISTVIYGNAYGKIRNEAQKTKVLLMSYEQIERYKQKFVFDHYQILRDYKNKIEIK